jgi:hypothetical protein
MAVGLAYRAKIIDNMAGLDMLFNFNFNAVAKTMPIAYRDRRGLFFIHTKHWLLNRRPKKISILVLTRFLYREVTSRPIYRTNQKRLCE